MKHKKTFIFCILLFSSALLFNSCFSYMTINSGSTSYKKERLKYAKSYYSEKDNSIGIEIDGKLKKQGKGKQFAVLNMDTVLAIYNPSFNNYNGYATPEQIIEYGIYEVYKNWYSSDDDKCLGIDIYKFSFNKGELDKGDFKLISTLEKKDIPDLQAKIKILKWEDLSNVDKGLEDFGAIDVLILKDKRKAWWRYCFLPVTIPADIATSPVQIVFAIIIINGLKKAYRS